MKIYSITVSLEDGRTWAAKCYKSKEKAKEELKTEFDKVFKKYDVFPDFEVIEKPEYILCKRKKLHKDIGSVFIQELELDETI